jgi:hypothetical protein
MASLDFWTFFYCKDNVSDDDTFSRMEGVEINYFGKVLLYLLTFLSVCHRLFVLANNLITELN